MYEVRTARGLEHLIQVLRFRIHYLRSIKHAGELKAGHPVKRATAPGDPRKEEVMLMTAAAGTCVHMYTSSRVCVSRVHACLNSSGRSKQSLSLSKCWASLTGCQRPQAFCPRQLAGHVEAGRLWRRGEASGAPQPLDPSKRCWAVEAEGDERKAVFALHSTTFMRTAAGVFLHRHRALPTGEPQG